MQAIVPTNIGDPFGSWDDAASLQKVTDVFPNLIYVFNHQTLTNEYSNRSLGELLGYSGDEIRAMGGSMLSNLLHPEDVERVFSNFDVIKALDDDELAHIEYRAKHKNGHWIWLLSTDTVFSRDAEGAVTRHLGSATDITAQKEAIAAAQRAEKEALAISDELRAFSYAMSHDMKSPSHTIALLLSELRISTADSISDDGAQLLDMAETTVTHMSRLVEDVLSYTRVIGQDFKPEAIALGDLVRDVKESLRTDIADAGADIIIGELPSVTGCRMQLHILMQNLMANAIKFHKPNVPPTVRINCTINRADNMTELTVADDGIGISTEKHGEIFRVFARLHHHNSFAGQGLGLAICRRIAANHNSDITLVSSQDEGAEFTIRLPLA